MASNSAFRALVSRAKKTPATVESLDLSELPKSSVNKAAPGDCNTLIKVDYSNLNYKDALVVTGSYPGMKYPMVGGIDLVGSVLSSDSTDLKEGQKVLINGFGVGTDHFGGFAEKASVMSSWCLPLEEAGNVDPLDAARIGTAGYTAMLLVDAMTSRVDPGHGPIVVTGATGGVGSVATALLNSMGYQVMAVTGKVEQESAYLKSIGAHEVIDRSGFTGDAKPLAKETYAGGIDTVGGNVLANVLSLIKKEGSVACCGNAGGLNLPTSVAPFILRGVSLLGIDSVYKPMEVRKKVYQKFIPILKENKALEAITANQVIGLDAVPEIASKMLKGENKGRYVVQIQD